MPDKIMDNLIITKMSEEHVRQVAAIEAKTFSVPWTEQGFVSALKREEACFYVASVDGVIAGYCGIYLAADEGEITNVAVAESFRRKGIGDLLVEEILSAAVKNGAVRVFLEVRKSNLPAILLYQKHGFREIGVRKAFYQQPTEDGVLMRWGEP